MSETLQIPDDWQPTAANINALPKPLRKYIHALETDCDPAGTIRSEVILREHTVPELQAAITTAREEGRRAMRDEAAKAVEDSRAQMRAATFVSPVGPLHRVGMIDGLERAANVIRALPAKEAT